MTRLFLRLVVKNNLWPPGQQGRHAQRTPGCALTAFAFIIALAMPSPVLAAFQQSGAAPHTISGRVLDPFGQVVAGARVVLQVDDGASRSTSSDETGRFSFEAPAFTHAAISAAKEGFATASVDLGPGDRLDSVEIMLSLANLADVVVVSAARGRGTRVADSAASITIVDENSILAGGERTLDDVLRARVPGFSLFRRTSSRVANPTTQGVSLRATGGSGASRTAVVDDGIPADDPFGGWIYWSRLPRARISSLEVVRGAASDAYGSNAIGGVIGVESRTILPRTFVANASFGNLESADVSLLLGHATSQDSWTQGGWGASLAVDSATSEGYIPVTGRQRGVVDEAAGGRYGTVEATVERRFPEGGFFGSGTRLFLRGQVFTEHRQNGTPLQRNSTASRLLILGGETEDRWGDSWRLRLYGGTQGYDQTFSTISLNRATESLNRLQRVPARQKGLSVVWSRGLASRLLATAGVEARQVRGFSDEIAYDAAGRATANTVAGGVQQTVGTFGNAEILATGKLRLTLAGRFDTWHNRSASSSSRSLLTPGAVARITPFPARRENSFSPRLGVVFTPVDRLSFRAAISRGFRAPTLNELYRDFRVGNVLTTGNPNLEAEKAINRELGLLWASREGRLAARATGFFTTIEDPISNITLSTTPALITRQRRNLGKSRSRGLEAEAEFRPAVEWLFSASYLFADARVREFSADPVLVGLRVPQIPRHSAAFQARFESPRLFTAGLVGRTTSESFDDDRNTLRLGSFLVVDLYLERALNRWVSIYLAVENLLDKEYATGRTPVTTVGMPQATRVGLNFRSPQR